MHMAAEGATHRVDTPLDIVPFRLLGDDSIRGGHREMHTSHSMPAAKPLS